MLKTCLILLLSSSLNTRTKESQPPSTTVNYIDNLFYSFSHLFLVPLKMKIINLGPPRARIATVDWDAVPDVARESFVSRRI
jgi:hypothetical protein